MKQVFKWLWPVPALALPPQARTLCQIQINVTKALACGLLSMIVRCK